MSALATRQLVIDIPGRNPGSPLDFAVERGQIWGILGPNGVGKTTLLHTLGGLRQPRSGAVTLGNKTLRELGRREIAREVGVVFQSNHDDFPATVAETVLIGRHPHGRKRAGWLPGPGIENADDLQIALDAMAQLELLPLQHRLTSTLSGGERQRVAIATVLAQQPLIWLVDEPTNHLDLGHQTRMLELLTSQAADGAAVVMCLHDLNIAARWCDHVLLLFDSGEACWGETDTMLVPDALATLYHQPLVTAIIDGAKVFVPRR